MDLGRLLARLVRLAALREVESARGSQTWSQRGRLGTSGCIETVLFFFFFFFRIHTFMCQLGRRSPWRSSGERRL